MALSWNSLGAVFRYDFFWRVLIFIAALAVLIVGFFVVGRLNFNRSPPDLKAQQEENLGAWPGNGPLGVTPGAASAHSETSQR